MRLTSVVLHSDYTSEDVEFSLRGTDLRSRYTVRNIAGIDAEELIPKFYTFGQESNAKYYEVTMKPREVVIRVTLNPQYDTNETVSHIRDKLYRLIAANRTGTIQLQFKYGATVGRVISGRVTKFEVAYFTQTPELQITFLCPDPTFRSVQPIVVKPEDLPTGSPIMLSDSASTAPHGLSFKIKVTSAFTHFTVQDAASSPDWSWSVGPTGGFAVDDELHFSSEFRNKLVYLHNLSSPKHIMDKVVPDSVWPIIFPGANELHFSNSDKFEWLELNYYSAYWGV